MHPESGAAAGAPGGVADDSADLRTALARAEQRFAAMVGSLGEVVFQTDLAGRFVYLNDAWTRMLGYPVGDSLGRFYQWPMHPDDRPASTERLHGLLTGAKDECRALFRMAHADTTLRWTEIVARPLRDESDVTIGLTGTFTDVTERVAAEEELTRERRRLLTVVEGTGVGIWERDEVTDEAWYSPEWARMLGYDAGELDPTYDVFANLLHPDDVAPHLHEARKVARGEQEFFEVQVRMRHRLGHWVWVRSRGRVMIWAADGTPAITAGTHTEVTDQVAAEQAARTAQKMEALGRVAGGIAHDFNNLLGVILGSADLIASGADAPAAVAVIRTATERATALTGRLLDLARERTGPVTVVDVNRVVADLQPMVANLLPPAIDLALDLAPAPLTIEVDSGQLTDTLLNLAVNARDAMPRGGTVTLRTELRPGDATNPDRVALTVRDTGVGIPSEVMQRIFEPFFTTKAAGEGTGLGLALAYSFAQQSGGSLTAASQPGAGAAFTLEFPRTNRPLVPVGPTLGATDPRAGGDGVCVLVVDDEGLLRELARAQLESAGYRVVLATGADDALARLGARPDIAVVFSDVVMPGGMSGAELAAAVAERHPAVGVVLTSGFATTTGGYDGPLLRKPYTRAELLAALDAAASPRAG